MLTADEQTRLRLVKLDSPQRVKWLRQKIAPCYADLAARVYFRLPYYVDGTIIEPESEAIDLVLRLGAIYHLSSTERYTAYRAQWKMALNKSEELGNHLIRIGKHHIDHGGTSKNLAQVFCDASRDFPDDLPFISRDEFEAIAQGFKKARPKRAAKP